jgi:hyperosmotically inducible periplasmic protein
MWLRMYFEMRKERSPTMKKIVYSFILFSALFGAGTVAMEQESTPMAPDNAAVNTRDRAPEAMTAGKQSNANGDVNLTRKIRRAVVKDGTLSTMAHNVKIVAIAGHVTLRGPVHSEQEKTVIANKAEAIAGAGNVDNQLDVKGE